MNNQRVVLGIDVGQTKTVLCVNTDQDSTKQSTFDGLTHFDNIGSKLIEYIDHALFELESTDYLIGIGFTYIPDRVTRESIINKLNDKYHSVNLVMFGDELSNHVGALGISDGVVLGVGTGISCTSMNLHQGFKTYGGYGYLLSDEGSGYWIGREGISSALRAFDGYLPKTKLLDQVLNKFESKESLIQQVYTAQRPSKLIAEFAGEVISHYEDDEVARSICEDAINLLAKQVVHSLLQSKNVIYSLTGGVMTSDLMCNLLIEEVQRRLPQAEYQKPLGNPIDGCLMVAREQERFLQQISDWEFKPEIYQSL